MLDFLIEVAIVDGLLLAMWLGMSITKFILKPW